MSTSSTWVQQVCICCTSALPLLCLCALTKLDQNRTSTSLALQEVSSTLAALKLLQTRSRSTLFPLSVHGCSMPTLPCICSYTTLSLHNH